MPSRSCEAEAISPQMKELKKHQNIYPAHDIFSPLVLMIFQYSATFFIEKMVTSEFPRPHTTTCSTLSGSQKPRVSFSYKKRLPHYNFGSFLQLLLSALQPKKKQAKQKVANIESLDCLDAPRFAQNLK